MNDTPQTDAYKGTHETHRIKGLTIYGLAEKLERERNAAVESVNATQGMADPAKEIAEMREALKEAGDAIEEARKLIEEKCGARGHGERYSAREMHGELLNKLDSALSKIQTILKP